MFFRDKRVQHLVQEVKDFRNPPVCENRELVVTNFFHLKLAGNEPVLQALLVLFLQ